MAFLIDLWMPILLSAVLVFIGSSIIHMVLPHHKKDYQLLDNEGALLEAMRSHNVQPGDYAFPYCANMKEMESEQMKAKMNAGPVGFMTVMPNGPWPMGKSLLQWFLYTVLVGVFIAYVASNALPQSADYLTVFRVTATAGFLCYALGGIPNSIWKAQSWGTTRRFIFDGLVYSLLTAGAFAWLWS